MTSSRIGLRWPRFDGARAVRIELSPEAEPSAPHATVRTLDGAATDVDIDGLAAAVDWFVRIVPEGLEPSRTVVVHQRTAGGPWASIDTKVREVLAVAPDALEVVIAGDDGGELERGPWEVTDMASSDGAARVAVRAVHRQSIPASAPNYDVRYEGRVTSDVIAEHRIFLLFGTPVALPALLSVRGPRGIAFRLAWSDRYLETRSVQLNQVGYNPRARLRYAYVSGYLGDGGALQLGLFSRSAELLAEPIVADATARHAVVRLGVKARSGPPSAGAQPDLDSGAEVLEIDLAAAPPSETERYRVRVPGVGVSWPTMVSERAVFKAYFTVTRGLFLNRWSGDLSAPFTDWVRPVDHGRIYTADATDFDAFFPKGTPREGERPMAFGHHDAGDFDQRPMHTAVAQILMRAYEIAPSHFGDGDLSLPESGNGTPDLLDEALWSVRAFESLQEADGGVRMGVETWRHPAGIYHANDDPQPYWTYAREANVSARAAGIFAQASRLLGSIDPNRAHQLLDRARRAFDYATSHGAKDAFLLYPAGELLLATGDTRFKESFERAYRSGVKLALGHLGFGDYREGARAMPDYLLAYMRSPLADPVIVRSVREFLVHAADEVVTTIESEHAHRSSRPHGYPWGWGQGVVLSRFADPIFALQTLGGLTVEQERRYFDALSLSADYALGGNPAGLVYFTQLGTRHVREPLHLDSLAWIKEGLGPAPGLPVYGPTDSIPRAAYTEPIARAFYPSFETLPLGLRYGDVRTLVVCNEFSVWETQAPQAELFAGLLGPGARRPLGYEPGAALHRSPLP